MRPDQIKFDEFTAPLLRLDSVFEMYANCKGFVLERNPLRKPGRILRRGTNPTVMIELFLEPFWFNVSYSVNLPYGYSVGGIYKDSDHRLWKYSKEIVNGRSIAWIEDHVSTLFEEATIIVDQCNSEYIVRHGIEVLNLRDS